ncbi:MAG: cation:proton antiporter [Methylophilaceae bacterium]
MISNPQWFLLVGLLMMTIGLTSTKMQSLPFTTSIVYLIAGLLLGPTFLGVMQFQPFKESHLLELLTEMAVLVSLFSVGVKMPFPIRFSQWKVPVLLATVSIVITISLAAAFAYYLLDLPLGAGILLGAILAPTDPVLATDVQIREPGDRDQLRFTLTSEGGMNDGTAFPFVMLGLGLLGVHDLGNMGTKWLSIDLLWATAGGIAIGIAAGKGLAWLTKRLRMRDPENTFKHEFLSLGLIGVVYGLAVMAHTWGFLAVFFAAVALHHREIRQDNLATPTPENKSSELKDSKNQEDNKNKGHDSTVSEGSLVFKEYLEGLSEVIIILLVGGMMTRAFWTWQTVTFALFLFAIARPISVLAVTIGSGTPWRMRSLVGWFGIRGIGSLYYLMYAINHGLQASIAEKLLPLTLVVITLSVFLHGISVKPLLGLLWKKRKHLA